MSLLERALRAIGQHLTSPVQNWEVWPLWLLVAYPALEKWLARYNVGPMQGRWRPRIPIREAARKAYEKTRAADVYEQPDGNSRLVYHVGAIFIDAKEGKLTIYGTHPPSTKFERITGELLRLPLSHPSAFDEV
jgi:hypothetical protein